MKIFNKEEIENFDRLYRLNLINSISGYKSANLIGTNGSSGENLAIISSFVHLGSNPALIGFIMRPDTVERHSLTNIKENGCFTINQVHENMVERAHYTSANFDKEVSEFEACKIMPSYIEGCVAPFVEESKVKMAMKLTELLPIKSNGTMMVVASVEQIILDEACLTNSGQLDLNVINTVCISGLNRYHKVKEIALLPYARVSELPTF